MLKLIFKKHAIIIVEVYRMENNYVAGKTPSSIMDDWILENHPKVCNWKYFILAHHTFTMQLRGG